MPHLSIEYSAGLESRADLPAVLRQLHGAMVETGIFPLAGIRVRAFRADHVIVADGLPENDFCAMTLSVGAGRSTVQLQDAGQIVFDAARAAFADLLASPHFALSLEIREIEPELSWKATPIHARLKAQK